LHKRSVGIEALGRKSKDQEKRLVKKVERSERIRHREGKNLGGKTRDGGLTGGGGVGKGSLLKENRENGTAGERKSLFVSAKDGRLVKKGRN